MIKQQLKEFPIQNCWACETGIKEEKKEKSLYRE